MAEEKPSLPADYVVPKVWEYKEQGGTFGGTNRPYAGAWGEDKPLEKGEHKIQLYSMGTPNGVKVTILLEELVETFPDFEYDAWLIPINGVQFTSGFHSVNPNSKIPAMMDYSDKDKPVRVFESGSIMLYLADKFDKDGKFFPKEYPARAECQSWLMWQMGSAPFIGGGFGHFYHYAPVKIEYAINRYAMETKRLLDVLDKHLGEGSKQYVCGDQYTIADMAIWPWIGWLVDGKIYGEAAEFLQVQEYKNVCAWSKRIGERPAVPWVAQPRGPRGPAEVELMNRDLARADREANSALQALARVNEQLQAGRLDALLYQDEPGGWHASGRPARSGVPEQRPGTARAGRYTRWCGGSATPRQHRRKSGHSRAAAGSGAPRLAGGDPARAPPNATLASAAASTCG